MDGWSALRAPHQTAAYNISLKYYYRGNPIQTSRSIFLPEPGLVFVTRRSSLHGRIYGASGKQQGGLVEKCSPKPNFCFHQITIVKIVQFCLIGYAAFTKITEPPLSSKASSQTPDAHPLLLYRIP